MINHMIDHVLTTIRCMLDKMEAVAQMMEVESTNIETVGQLMISFIATIHF